MNLYQRILERKAFYETTENTRTMNVTADLDIILKELAHSDPDGIEDKKERIAFLKTKDHKGANFYKNDKILALCIELGYGN